MPVAKTKAHIHTHTVKWFRNHSSEIVECDDEVHCQTMLIAIEREFMQLLAYGAAISFHSICWSRFHQLKPFSFVCWCIHSFCFCHDSDISIELSSTHARNGKCEFVDRVAVVSNLSTLYWITATIFLRISDTWHLIEKIKWRWLCCLTLMSGIVGIQFNFSSQHSKQNTIVFSFIWEVRIAWRIVHFWHFFSNYFENDWGHVRNGKQKIKPHSFQSDILFSETKSISSSINFKISHKNYSSL